jgi:hypothetical protein
MKCPLVGTRYFTIRSGTIIFVITGINTNFDALWLYEPEGFFTLRQTNGTLTVSTNATAQQLAQLLAPSWITISNATYTGADVARGTFAGGNGCGLPIDSGVILSSGQITNAIGPNDDSGETAYVDGSSNLHEAGDNDLSSLVGGGETLMRRCWSSTSFLPIRLYCSSNISLRLKNIRNGLVNITTRWRFL